MFALHKGDGASMLEPQIYAAVRPIAAYLLHVITATAKRLPKQSLKLVPTKLAYAIDA